MALIFSEPLRGDLVFLAFLSRAWVVVGCLLGEH